MAGGNVLSKCFNGADKILMSRSGDEAELGIFDASFALLFQRLAAKRRGKIGAPSVASLSGAPNEGGKRLGIHRKILAEQAQVLEGRAGRVHQCCGNIPIGQFDAGEAWPPDSVSLPLQPQV